MECTFKSIFRNDHYGRVTVAGAALGEATETWINTTNRGIAKTLLPRPPRQHQSSRTLWEGFHLRTSD